VPVIGFLSTRAPGEDAYLLAAFHQGLKEAGFVERQNVAIEYHFAENQYDRLPALAADLVRRQVAVIAAPGSPSAPAAKAATTTIPIVFSIGGDPVKLGLVASLNRPGGNLTGVAGLGVELEPKRLELLHELVPMVTIIAGLVNPNTPAAEVQSRDMQASARALGLQIHVLHASSERDFEPAFATLVQRHANALVIGRQAVELAMTDEEIGRLGAIARSRSEAARRVQRAQILLACREKPSFFGVRQRLALHHRRSNAVSSGRWLMARRYARAVSMSPDGLHAVWTRRRRCAARLVTTRQ
jgi:ABC transporter substrate binding protein